jgi:ATP-dependent Clp protease adaptor protein ClpS
VEVIMNSVEEQTDQEVVVTTTRPAPVNKPKQQPRYAVVVLNDDLHTVEYVILALAKVFGYSMERGYQLASEIDTSGRAIVWTGALEHAELKRDQLRGMGPDVFAPTPVEFPLGVELEPVD